MATHEIHLPYGGALPGDGSATNVNGPAIRAVIGSSAKVYVGAFFDPTTNEHLWWARRMPENYVGTLVAKILWQANDVGAGESCLWNVQIGAITPADTDTPQEHAMATTNEQSTDVNTTEANRLIETTITLTNDDGVAAGDLMIIHMFRNAAGGGDDLSSDAVAIGELVLTYSDA